MREFSLLEHVYAANATLDRRVVIPPGDDMGMVELESGARILAAVDQVIDGCHFRLATTPLRLIGRKALTRCLSDVAAMAARPVCSLVAVALPPDFGEQRARELFDAMRETASRFDAPLIGGDIAIHVSDQHPLCCSVTVLAGPLASDLPPIERSGAKPGDDLFVTGVLGGSCDREGLGHHLTFEPRIKVAAELSRVLRGNLHAMIDLSDGLGRDAAHLAEMSRVRIEIKSSAIPCRDGVAWRQAVGDGEDYELCFAAVGPVPAEIIGVPVTRIGRVVDATGSSGGGGAERPVVVVRDGSMLLDAGALGWEHRS